MHKPKPPKKSFNRWNGDTKYPWSKWLKKGAAHTLLKGRDYEGTTHSFISYLYQRAGKKYGAKITINELPKGIRLTCIRVRRKSA